MKRYRRTSICLLAICIVGAIAAPTVAAQSLWSCGGVAATIVGTPGDDQIRGTNGDDVIVAREGNDTILAMDGDDIVCAGKGDDVVGGGQGFDIIFGAQGDDELFAAIGNQPEDRADTRGSRIFGGSGDDTIVGSNRWDRMQGGPGEDLLFGYEGRDWIRGGADTDAIDGGDGIDDLHGGNGLDYIRATAGDVVRGGAGRDRCDLDGEPATLRSCGRNEVEAAKPTRSGPTIGVVSSSCDPTANVLGFWKCTTRLRNTNEQTMWITTNVELLSEGGRIVDTQSKVEFRVDPDEVIEQTFLTDSEVATVRISSVEAVPQERYVSGDPIRLSPEVTRLAIDSSFISIGTPQIGSFGITEVDLVFRNVSGSTGVLVATVAFFDDQGVRIDSEIKQSTTVRPQGEAVITYFPDAEVTTFRVLSVSLVESD